MAPDEDTDEEREELRRQIDERNRDLLKKAAAGPLEFDEARHLPPEGRKPGLRVKGKVTPFGGSWLYDPEADELTLKEAQTG